MGFTKLWSSLVTSSVWCEDDATLRVWIAMLALANADGLVEGSVPGFASLCRIPIEACEAALSRLAGPDAYSRTPDHDGRRIEAVPGGWRILNYRAYRERGQDQGGSRAAYMRGYRARRDVTAVTRYTEAEAEADAEKTPPPPTPPTGGKGKAKAEPTNADPQWRSLFPEPLASDSTFARVFDAFLTERRRKTRRGYSEAGLRAVGERLARWGLRVATQQVERSIGYQGVIEPSEADHKRARSAAAAPEPAPRTWRDAMVERVLGEHRDRLSGRANEALAESVVIAVKFQAESEEAAQREVDRLLGLSAAPEVSP